MYEAIAGKGNLLVLTAVFREITADIQNRIPLLHGEHKQKIRKGKTVTVQKCSAVPSIRVNTGYTMHANRTKLERNFKVPCPETDTLVQYLMH